MAAPVPPITTQRTSSASRASRIAGGLKTLPVVSSDPGEVPSPLEDKVGRRFQLLEPLRRRQPQGLLDSPVLLGGRLAKHGCELEAACGHELAERLQARLHLVP